MPTIEEMKRFIAIRYLSNTERSNRIVSGNCTTFLLGRIYEDENFLRLLDDAFACAETPEQKRIIAEKLAMR